jgi:hypothetical protein
MTIADPGTSMPKVSPPDPPRGLVADSATASSGGRQLDQTGGTKQTALRATSSEDQIRDAILADLYDDRRKLLAQRRIGTLSSRDEAYLGEINAEIDRLELATHRSAAENVVWQRLEALAGEFLDLHERIGNATK